MANALTFLTGANAEYIAHLYTRFMQNPEKVDASWQAFFRDLKDDEVTLLLEMGGASWTPVGNRHTATGFDMDPSGETMREAQSASGGDVNEISVRQAATDSIRALQLIRAYRVRGHLIAKLDPLELKTRPYHPELDPTHYGFSDTDYDRPIFINGMLGMQTATLRDIVAKLRQIYCGSIGVEFLHISDPEEKAWIQDKFEKLHSQSPMTADQKRGVLQRLTATECFEKFLHVKFTGTKRFGLDGGESTIAAIEQIITTGVGMGVEEVIFGMAHRGRLNVLTNVLGKPFTAVFRSFREFPQTRKMFRGPVM